MNFEKYAKLMEQQLAEQRKIWEEEVKRKEEEIRQREAEMRQKESEIKEKEKVNFYKMCTILVQLLYSANTLC